MDPVLDAPPTRRKSRDPVRLPEPAPLLADPLGAVLRRRACTTTPRRRTLAPTLLSGILAHGLAPWWHDDGRSGLDLSSVFDVFVVIYDVAGMEPGVVYHDPVQGTVDRIRTGDFREEMQQIIIGQHHAKTAACTFLISIPFGRVQSIYRHDRALRHVYLHAGRLIGGLLLVATAYRLTTAITPALSDSSVLELLRMDPVEEVVLYSMSVG